jgi:hypothetical protein
MPGVTGADFIAPAKQRTSEQPIPAKLPKNATNPTLAADLWLTSEELTHVRFTAA